MGWFRPNQGESRSRTFKDRDYLGRKVKVTKTSTQTELDGHNNRTRVTRRTWTGREVVVKDDTKYRRGGSLDKHPKSSWW